MTGSILNVEQTPPILDGERAATLLASDGITLETSTTTIEEELVELVTGYDGIMVHAGVPVTRAVIEAGDELEVIARCGIGVDNVDLEAAAENGIPVVNHPHYSVDEVATHSLSLLLAGWRAIGQYDRATRSGTWSWAEGAPLNRLRESTLGIVGFGSIGRRLAELASGFGCEMIASDPYVEDQVMAQYNVEPVDLDTLCERADLVSINAELTAETRNLIGPAELDTLDDTAVLVNTARGAIVDTEALVATLEAGELGYAGLDVTEPEPLPASHPLYERDDVTITPHAGWYSKHSRIELTQDIVADVKRVLRGDSPRNPVVPDTK